MVSLAAAAALGAASLLVVAPAASAQGSCNAYRPTLTYAYAVCSGVLDTGLMRVTVRVCNSRGCWSDAGPWVSKASGKRSAFRAGAGQSLLAGPGVQIQST
jgi:hypothetical protein